MSASPQPEPPLNPDVWTGAAARRELLALYEQRVDAIAVELERRRVPTRYGETQVLLGGQTSAPALLILHGANGDAAQMASAYAPCCARWRCVFVDLPGGATPSDGAWIPRGDASLARWMAELLDGLGLERVALLGMSGGAYVALRAAAGLGERVRAVGALVPEGFVPIGDIPEPTADNAAAFVHAITEPDCGFPAALVELMIRGTRVALAATRHPLRPAPLFEAGDFDELRAPVMIVAGGRDRIFPGEALLARARVLLPGLRERLLPEANHVHLALLRGDAVEAVERFLLEADAR